jgi:superoxide dismutase, Cu-Zn family
MTRVRRVLCPLFASVVLAACAAPEPVRATPMTTRDGTVHAHDASGVHSGHHHDAQPVAPVRRAVARLEPMGLSRVTGTLTFTVEGDGVRVRGSISGLSPGAHGFHVHEFGDLSDRSEGLSAGDHFAPGGTPHGRPSDSHRHVGDLGNVVAGEDGVAVVNQLDPMLRLEGPHSIVGRSIVVHANEDKFTQPSGDAGPRVAIGVIGIAGQEE